MPRRRRARPRHRMRTKRQIRAWADGRCNAGWWNSLVAQVEQLVRESGSSAGFDARAWLNEFIRAPSPALGGRTPLVYLETARGHTQVSQLIAQMQSGAYG